MNPRWKLSNSALSKIVRIAASLFALGVPLLGVFYLVNERDEILRERSHEIMALGRLRVEQVSAWLGERMQDAEFLHRNPATVIEAVRRRTGKVGSRPSGWMLSMIRNGQYRSITFLSPDGRPLSWLPAKGPEGHQNPEAMQRALTTRTVVVDDLRRYDDGTTRMHLYVPLIGTISSDAATPAGIVIFEIDPADRLSPLIDSWPVPSRSARSTLLRVVGDSVECLDLRSGSGNGSVASTFPLERSDLPASRAARGYQGIVDGFDHRGMEVVAFVAPVPRSSWLMVSKIDREEILSRWREERVLVAIASAFALLFAISIVVMMRRLAAQRLGEERTRHLSELEAIRRHQSEIMDLANDIVILSDGDDRILQANRMASSVYGVELGELVGRSVASLRVDGDSEAYRQSLARLRRRGQLRYTAEHRGANGRRLDVEVSARHLEIDGRTYIQRIVRDVTERVAYEAELRRLNRMRSVLSGVNRVITREQQEADMLNGVCSTAVSEGAFPLVWIGRVNEDQTEVIPVAAAGVAAPHAATVRIPLTPSPTSLGFDGTPLVSGTPIVIDDLERDVRGRPWRDDAKTYGLRSVAIVPVRVDGQLWGVVSFAASGPSYGSREELDLMSEIAADIGFALSAVRTRQLRAAAEDRLAEQETIYRAMFENSGEAILLTHPDGTIISMNPEALRMFGRHADEIPRLHRSDFVDVADPKVERAVVERERTGRFSGELSLRRADGTRFTGEVSSVIFTLSNGERQTTMTIRDVTKRHLSEQMVRSQLLELQRWHEVTLDREARIMELKREVNQLLCQCGEPTRYFCVDGQPALDGTADRPDVGALLSEVNDGQQ